MARRNPCLSTPSVPGLTYFTAPQDLCHARQKPLLRGVFAESAADHRPKFAILCVTALRRHVLERAGRSGLAIPDQLAIGLVRRRENHGYGRADRGGAA